MTRVVHFEIHAEDPARAAKFYTDVFGWKIEKWASDTMDFWMVTTGDKDQPGINGGIVKRMGAAPAESAPVNGYVCTLQVEGIDDYIAKAQAAGATIALPKMQMGDDTWQAFQAYLKDTEGNIFGLHEPIKK
jgi:predicted enzyme related to lactoylglutathione lyase